MLLELQEGESIQFNGVKMYIWHISNEWAILLNSSKMKPLFSKVAVSELDRSMRICHVTA